MLQSRWAGHLICDLSRIIATWCSYCSVNPLLPQNCIYLQSDLSCLYKLICHLFNHHERLLGIGHQQSAIFIFGTACKIYCYGRYCVRRSVSPQVPENPSGPLVDNFIVLPCVAFGVACVKLLPGVDRWNSLDVPRVIGPCHYEVWGWPRH